MSTILSLICIYKIGTIYHFLYLVPKIFHHPLPLSSSLFTFVHHFHPVAKVSESVTKKNERVYCDHLEGQFDRKFVNDMSKFVKIFTI